MVWIDYLCKVALIRMRTLACRLLGRRLSGGVSVSASWCSSITSSLTRTLTVLGKNFLGNRKWFKNMLASLLTCYPAKVLLPWRPSHTWLVTVSLLNHNQNTQMCEYGRAWHAWGPPGGPEWPGQGLVYPLLGLGCWLLPQLGRCWTSLPKKGNTFKT